MNISPACTAPVHAPLQDSDSSHPLYSKYLSYRAAMSAQMVYCQPFSSWLSTVEHEEKRKRGELPYQIVDRHPRGKKYWAYMRQYHGEHGSHDGALEFDKWLEVTI